MVNPLARVIMEKNLKTEKVINSRAVKEKEVIEGSKKNTAITLEEAANRMKNNR
jgi:hypothetical protein